MKWFKRKDQHEHTWSNWRVVHQGDITRTKDNSIVGYTLTQERHCIKCGFKELHVKKHLIFTV